MTESIDVNLSEYCKATIEFFDKTYYVVRIMHNATGISVTISAFELQKLMGVITGAHAIMDIYND